MAVSYRIDAARRLVITTLSDTLSLSECFQHHEKLAADPDFRPDYRELMDGSAVTRVAFDSAAVISLSKSCPFGANSRRAIYCGDSLMNYGMARMFQTLAQGRHGEIGVFRTAVESAKWLDEHALLA